jgi:hypothetical protein
MLPAMFELPFDFTEPLESDPRVIFDRTTPEHRKSAARAISFRLLSLYEALDTMWAAKAKQVE